MDDAAGVCEGDGVGHANEQSHAFGHCARVIGPRVEPLATDKLHHVEQAAIRQRADVVHGDDAGMFEVCQDPRFGLEPRQRGGIGRATEHLERDIASQRAVGDAIDRAHTPAAQRLHHLVPGARQVGQIGDLLEMPERRVAQMHAGILCSSITKTQSHEDAQKFDLETPREKARCVFVTLCLCG